nr:hypothetical protein [uncultured Carboxylicivirga sp.]
MTDREKKRKAAMIAVAYYLEQEKAAAVEAAKPTASAWAAMGKGMIMTNRTNVQRRGRLLMKAV